MSDASVSLSEWRMTTRSGKPYNKATMEELQGMLKLLAQEERRRNSEREGAKSDERLTREQENRKKMEMMQTHMESLMKLVEDMQKSKGVSPKQELSIKLVPLSDMDDIEAYLVTFARNDYTEDG